MRVQCSVCDAALLLPGASAGCFRCPHCGAVSKPNYYEILEIAVNADQEVIKTAYRILAFKYHPDRNPAGGERMRLVNEAYNAPCDPVGRQRYDEKRTRERCDARQAAEQKYRQEQQADQVLAPDSAPLQRSPGVRTILDSAALFRLRKLGEKMWPGNLAAWAGFATLLVFSLFSCCCLPYLASVASARPEDVQAAAQDHSPALGLMVAYSCVLIAWGAGVPALMLLREWLNHKYAEQNSVRLDYALTDEQKAQYADLLRSLAVLARLGGLWEITGVSGGHFKYNAGVSTLWSRRRASCAKGLPRCVSCNLAVYYLQAGFARHYFLPDCVLVCAAGGRVYCVPYSDTAASVRSVQFRENGYTPNDATVVGHAWKYTNVDGSPDRRLQVQLSGAYLRLRCGCAKVWQVRHIPFDE